jgi:hypothetical protein
MRLVGGKLKPVNRKKENAKGDEYKRAIIFYM